MGKENTILGGITTTSAYNDGQMYSMLNLREKNGALQPVMPAGITGVLPLTPEEQEKIAYLFEHHNEDYRHYIIVFKDNDQESVSSICWIDRTQFEAGESAADDMINIYDKAGHAQSDLQTIAGNINSIEQNGNMLIFVGQTRQYYALWRGDSYTWYGEIPDLPAINFTCIEEHEFSNTDEDLKIQLPEGVELSGGRWVNARSSVTGALSFMEATGSKTNLSIKDELKTITERMITLSRARLTEQYAGTQYEENKGGFGGLFFDAFMVRYAFRLYDNNTVKLSPPILVMPSGKLYDYIRIAMAAGGSVIKIDKANGFQTSQEIPAKGLVYMGQENDKPWGDHVMDDPLTAPLWLSLNVATGGLLGLYDFFSDNDYLFWNQDQELFAPPFSYMKVKGYVPGIKYDLRDFERYEGLIESVDIFISPEVGIMNIENANVEDAAADSFKGITPSPIVDFEKNSRNPGWMNVLRPGSLQSPISDPGEALNNITERGEFFLVKSLKLGSKSGSGDQAGYEKFPSLDDRETIYNIRNLVHQELLEDNDAGIHRFGSDGTYSYNRRMHWYGVTQEYFRGFDWNFFKWEVVSPDQDGGYEIKRRVITRPLRGQENDSRRSVAIDPDDDYTDYNGIKSKYSMLMAGKSRVILETVIETKGKVYSSVQMEDRIFGSAMISYPDANAKKITIYFQEPNDNVIAGGSVYGEKPLQKVMELPLTEHKRLNLAYYLTPQLEPVMGVKSETAQHLTDAIINRPLLSVNANELRVSETDNPLEVQYQNIMHIGNDRILGIGANVMNVSGQNFGQFPLFVITDSGVYALATGVAEAAYTNMHHIAFGEPATSGLTCQTPAGLIYVGANGLYFINGTKAELLTKAVEQNPDRLHLEYKPVMDAPLRLFTGDDDGGDFKTYIRKADNMWYDNINNELSIWKAGTVGWTVGLDNGVIYRNSLLPAMAIKNTANNAMWIDRLNVLDMLSTRKINDDERPVTVDVNFITRPMNYGTPDTKTLNRIILRGILYGENKTADVNNKFPVIVTWRSNDNRNFIISKGLLLKECNYRSIDTGNYFMQKFRSYIVAFGGKMADGTKITMIESEIEKSYPFSK